MSPQRKKCVYIYNGEKEEMSLVSWGRRLGPALPGLEEEQPVCPAGSLGSLAPVLRYHLFSSVLRTEGGHNPTAMKARRGWKGAC